MELARRLAPILDCSPADLLPETEGFTVPLTLRAGLPAAGGSMSFELEAPFRRIPTLPQMAPSERRHAVEIDDDHADLLWLPHSILIVDPIAPPARLKIGQKIIVRTFTETRKHGKVRQVLAGLLDVAAGDLVILIRSNRADLPASLTIQRAHRPRGISERIVQAVPALQTIDYVPNGEDPAEIVATVSASLSLE